MGDSRSGRPWRRVGAQLRALGLPCAICGRPINYDLPPNHRQSFTADHVVPMALGGTNTIDNVRPAHRSCNSRRGKRMDFVHDMHHSRDW
ncbi:HNH endonuclease [Saccharopolyspora shandongensis]|uniref:HNH endonuclease n=1 Tax=Saccharopolyspora shandongensis TaxID=418495 RepID=UPI00340D5221